MKRYEIRWARLNPVEGSEIGKTRPVVIVSMDVLNAKLRTVTVCPVTKQLHPQWRTRLAIRCSGRAAEIAVDPEEPPVQLEFSAFSDRARRG